MAMRDVGVPVEGVAKDKPPGWPEAVAELAAERTRVVACAARARTFDAATASALAVRYANAKAEVDAVLAGLTVALAQRGNPGDLPSLQASMEAGATLRQEFCQAVIDHAPLTPGEKGVVINLLGGLVAPLTEAVKALWEWRNEQDALRRDTIRAQLEATRWPDFSAIPPAQ